MRQHEILYHEVSLYFFYNNNNEVCFYISLPCSLKYKSIRFTSIWSISFWFLTHKIPDNDGDWRKACLITVNPVQNKGSVLPLVTLLRIAALHVSLDWYFFNPDLFKMKQISAMIVKIGRQKQARISGKIKNEQLMWIGNVMHSGQDSQLRKPGMEPFALVSHTKLCCPRTWPTSWKEMFWMC